jgi:hypothetical protein
LPRLACHGCSCRTRSAGKRGHAKPKSCQTLLGKWRQAGDSHHMRKVLNKRDKIERKMAKHGCPAPTLIDGVARHSRKNT